MEKLASSGTLCFKEDEFLSESFSVDVFVSSCKDRVSMSNLREDLEVHYKNIQLALIELINNDYADFVSLSSNLIGTEKTIDNIGVPLGQLKEEVLSVKTYLSDELSRVNTKLEERKKIRENKSRLHHLINVVHSVEKIEKILTADPSSPDMEIFLHEDRTNPGHFLERIAGEFNQLQFHVKQSKGHPIIQSIIPRVSLITSKLQTNLESTFQQGIATKQPEVILRCLRTYALIDKVFDAEVLFRNTVVKPFAKSIITETYHTTHGTEKMCHDIIKFLDDECKIVFNLTSDVTSSSSANQELLLDDDARQGSVKGFDFLVNSVWVEIAASFEERLPLLFSPGNPKVFLQRYKVMMSFLEEFEDRCVSIESLHHMRQHPSYNSFLIKWSLPVYFQIRFQEIGGLVEMAADNPYGKSPNELFMSNIVGQCWESIVMCWDDSVYISPLKGRLWKLTLQIISRLSTIVKGLVMAQGAATQPSSMESLTLVLGDGCYLSKKVHNYFTEVISSRLQDAGSLDIGIYKQALTIGSEALDVEMTRLEDHIVTRIASEGALQLDNVKNVPRLYRRTNKEPPTQPSQYVSLAFTSIHDFKKTLSTVEDTQQTHIIKRSVREMSAKYYSAVEELLTSIKKTEESLLRLKQQRKAAAGQVNTVVGVKGNEVSDENKIRTQIHLDAVEYGVQISSIDLNVEEFPEYVALRDITLKALESTASND